jgi:hypothetical protein
MPSTLVPGVMHTDQDTWEWLGQDGGSDGMSEGEDSDTASSDTMPGTPKVDVTVLGVEAEGEVSR